MEAHPLRLRGWKERKKGKQRRRRKCEFSILGSFLFFRESQKEEFGSPLTLMTLVSYLRALNNKLPWLLGGQIPREKRGCLTESHLNNLTLHDTSQLLLHPMSSFLGFPGPSKDTILRFPLAPHTSWNPFRRTTLQSKVWSFLGWSKPKLKGCGKKKGSGGLGCLSFFSSRKSAPLEGLVTRLTCTWNPPLCSLSHFGKQCDSQALRCAGLQL